MFADSAPARIGSAIAGVAAALVLGAAAAAETLPDPAGPVLLTVEGAIEATNGDGVARFDDAMLADLPQVTFTTSTIWTKERAVTFSGPALATVLEAAGATGNAVQARAINDYMVKFTRDDLTEAAPIVATRIDGKPYGIRENGPLWIVYPYDAGPEYQTELVYAQSIWQLVHLQVVDE